MLDNVISVKDKEIYTYGLVQGLVMIINIVTTVLIGFALGMVMECCVFLALYIPIRRYAGGYHAKTQARCYLFSIIMILVSMWMIENIAWTLQINLIISVNSSVVILILAPVEDANKLLDYEEKRVYKKRTRVILSILLILACFISGMRSILSVVVLVLSVMLIIGKIKNYNQCSKCEKKAR